MKDTNNMIEGSTGSTPDSQPVTPHTCSPPPQARSDVPIPLNQPAFQRLPGETPRSYSAFIAWFQLGHSRSLQGVADNLDESISNIKKWSSRFAWSRRLQTFNAGLLQDQAAQIADANRKNTADWTQRLHAFREQEWDAAQKLLTAAQCFLESFGDEDVGKMTLSHVSRALRIASHIGRD